MSHIVAYKNRGITRYLTVLNALEEAIVPGSSDKLRVIISRTGQTTKLTVTSDAATANGSSLTKNSPESGKHTLRLDASDLNFEPGTYSFRFDYYDASDAAEWKNVDRQVFSLLEDE